VLDHSDDVGFQSGRQIASAAGVKPNTLVRMARAFGYAGFDDFRESFRERLKAGSLAFPDRARWLQSLAHGGRHAGLFKGMAESTIGNIESLFSHTTVDELKSAADRIVAAGQTFVLGVGISYALAHNFAYLARMALNTIVAVPRDGSLPIDDVARAGPDDVLLAMTFTPCRTEVIDAVVSAKQQGAYVIGITDSNASPLALQADQVFAIPTETPQFFTSAVAAAALLETLMAFVIADADDHVIENIERFHRRRHELGVYYSDEVYRQ
jgi:DNA-binding MurR/RpiR family transcriptional regulator